MIEGIRKVKNEQEYRATLMDSSSSLKEFSLDRKKYYRKYILGETVEDKDTAASVMGKVVETILLEPDLFDSRFYLSSVIKAPTGKMLDFVNALCELTFNCTNENNEVTRTFEDMAIEARSIAEFDWSLKVILDRFIGKDPEIYYNEIRTTRAKGLTVITANDHMNGEAIIEELKNNFVTRDIINLVNSDRWEVKNQYQIEGYEIDGHKFKSMIDKVVIDHKEKTIQVYDLKCVWNVEGFYEDYYLYRRAYIQAYLYYKASQQLVEMKEYFTYLVLPPKFIVCDSINYYNPLIYTLNTYDLFYAYEGFEHKGRTYPGIQSIIEDLKWALENNQWNISRENYLSNGVVNIKKKE